MQSGSDAASKLITPSRTNEQNCSDRMGNCFRSAHAILIGLTLGDHPKAAISDRRVGRIGGVFPESAREIEAVVSGWRARFPGARQRCAPTPAKRPAPPFGGRCQAQLSDQGPG